MTTADDIGNYRYVAAEAIPGNNDEKAFKRAAEFLGALTYELLQQKIRIMVARFVETRTNNSEPSTGTGV